MAIKRYTATKDNTITNAFKANLDSRGSDANMGASDILEVFSIYGQASTSSAELSRVLVQFPTNQMSIDRTSGSLPASGSVKFYLKMFNAKHTQPLPRDMKLVVLPISQSWDEGFGLDMEDYKDLGFPTITGSTWMTASFSNPWHTPGGDYYAKPVVSQSFADGTENLEIEVTSLVEEWLAGTKTNYGFGVHITGSQEAYSTASLNSVLTNTAGAKQSYYTKKFHARKSEFFFKRPIVEARWDNKTTDDRRNFYYSSSLADSVDNLNTLYLYNYVKGNLKNIKGIGKKVAIYVSLYSGSVHNEIPEGSKLSASADVKYLDATIKTNITGGYAWQGDGIYTASFALTGNSQGTLTKVFDVWHNGSGSVLKAGTIQYATSSFEPRFLSASMESPGKDYVTKITNLKSTYSSDEEVRFRVFNRPKNWNPNIYTAAATSVQNTIIESASFKIYRVRDNYEVIRHSTSSVDKETFLSYDKNGNYFDLDMNMLEPDYAYGIELSYYVGDKWVTQKDKFRFRVEEKK